MDDGGSWAGVAVVGLALAAGLMGVVGTMGWGSDGPGVDEEPVAESGEVAEPEAELADELGEPDQPYDIINYYKNCASVIGCVDSRDWGWELWIEQQLSEGKDPFPPHETASNCIGFCFNAIVESVDEENQRLARVVMIGKKGRKTPAIVERTSISSSSLVPAAEGQPVRFACFDRFVEKHGLRFESCSQVAAPQ